MKTITSQTGALYYIDPDKVFRHVDVTTQQSRFGYEGVSDAPAGLLIGYRDLEISSDATRMVNDQLTWGVGQGSANPVFARTTDSASVAEHGLWQQGEIRYDMYCQESVDRRSEAWVYGSPQSLRGGKDDRVMIRATVFEPYFRVSDVVRFESTTFGVDEPLPIRGAEITFPTPFDIQVILSVGHELDAPWSTFEFWFPLSAWEPPEIGGIELPPLPPGPSFPGFGCGGGQQGQLRRALLVECHPQVIRGADYWTWDTVNPEPVTIPGHNTQGWIKGYPLEGRNGGSVAFWQQVQGTITFRVDPGCYITLNADVYPYGESYDIWYNSPFGPWVKYSNARAWAYWLGPGGTPDNVWGWYHVLVQYKLGEWLNIDTRYGYKAKVGGQFVAPAGATHFAFQWWDMLGAPGNPHPITGAPTPWKPVQWDNVSISLTCPEGNCEDPDAPDGQSYRPPTDAAANGITAVWRDGQLLVEGVHYDLCGTNNNYVCPIGDASEWRESEVLIRYWELGDPCAGTPPGGMSGPGGDGPVWGEVPTQTGARIYSTAHQFLRGSSEVWVGGRRIRLGYDYLEYPRTQKIEILSHVNLGGGDQFDPPKTVIINYIIYTFEDPPPAQEPT